MRCIPESAVIKEHQQRGSGASFAGDFTAFAEGRLEEESDEQELSAELGLKQPGHRDNQFSDASTSSPLHS